MSMLRLEFSGIYRALVAALAVAGCAGANRAQPLVGDDMSPCLREHADTRILFAGDKNQLLENFQSWNGAEPSSAWVVSDKMVSTHAGHKYEDLILKGRHSSFVLKFDYLISQNGNSGVKYWVDGSGTDAVGFEFQIIDDLNHPDATKGAEGTRRTAALYGIWPSNGAASMAERWSSACIVVAANHVEHWLDGNKVAAIALDTKEFHDAFLQSKFADRKDMLTRRNGTIFFQNHGEAVSFRNIRLRSF